MDGENPADDVTIVVYKKGEVTDDATATINEWTDEESTDDENAPWG